MGEMGREDERKIEDEEQRYWRQEKWDTREKSDEGDREEGRERRSEERYNYEGAKGGKRKGKEEIYNRGRDKREGRWNKGKELRRQEG